MKFAEHAGHRFLSLGLIGAVAVGLSGCGGIGGTTYGTGVGQEEALVKDITGIAGDTSSRPPIDYSARPGLVLPPKDAALPTPEEAAKANAIVSNWPQDPDKLRAAYNERMQNMTDREREALLAEIRKLPKAQRDAIFKNDPRSVAFANAIQDYDYGNGPPTDAQSKEYSRQVRERIALIKQANGKKGMKRQYLTQPPEKYTELSPEVKRAMETAGQEEAPKKKEGKGFFGRIWPF